MSAISRDMNRVPWSVKISEGSIPTRSIPMREKDTSIMGRGIRGLGGGLFSDVSWHVGQLWQNLLPLSPNQARETDPGVGGYVPTPSPLQT